jgi:hypothetical protein
MPGQTHQTRELIWQYRDKAPKGGVVKHVIDQATARFRSELQKLAPVSV